MSRVTSTLALPSFPPAFRATAVSVLLPSVKGTWTVKLPELAGAATPLTVTVAFGSLTVPRTVVGLIFVKLKFPGEVIVTIGAGTCVTLTVPELELPATSVASAVMELELSVTLQLKFDPLTTPAIPLQVTFAMPDKLSPALPDTVTAEE